MGNRGCFTACSVKKLAFSINRAQSGPSLVGDRWKFLLKLHKMPNCKFFALAEILKEKRGAVGDPAICGSGRER